MRCLRVKNNHCVVRSLSKKTHKSELLCLCLFFYLIGSGRWPFSCATSKSKTQTPQQTKWQRRALGLEKKKTASSPAAKKNGIVNVSLK